MSRIEALLVDDTAGDPMTGLKWSRKSTRSVSKTLAAEGVAASPNTVAACLKRLNFSLQRNRKSIGETRHPQRDQQFRHLSAIKASFEDRGQPVISVDSKKRELVGLFLNPGQTWCWMGREVLTHDFRSQSFGVALPYGIYDPQRNAGTVVVGTSHDTAEFAVDAIETWLTTYGWYHHPDMRELLILCDTGGSNSAQSHLWKYCLSQRLVHSLLSAGHGLSLSAGSLQVESHRPPPLQFHQPQLGRGAAGVLCAHPQLLAHHHHKDRPDGRCHPQPQTLRHRQEDQHGTLPPDRDPTRRDLAAMELHHSTASSDLSKCQLISAQPLSM